jgi:hypothetical protein
MRETSLPYLRCVITSTSENLVLSSPAPHRFARS